MAPGWAARPRICRSSTRRCGTAKGKMISLATETERTLFFDFLPLDLGRSAALRLYLTFTFRMQRQADSAWRGLLFSWPTRRSSAWTPMLKRSMSKLPKEHGYDFKAKFPTCCSSTNGTCLISCPWMSLGKELRKKNEPILEAVAFQGYGSVRDPEGDRSKAGADRVEGWRLRNQFSVLSVHTVEERASAPRKAPKTSPWGYLLHRLSCRQHALACAPGIISAE